MFIKITIRIILLLVLDDKVNILNHVTSTCIEIGLTKRKSWMKNSAQVKDDQRSKFLLQHPSILLS